LIEETLSTCALQTIKAYSRAKAEKSGCLHHCTGLQDLARPAKDPAARSLLMKLLKLTNTWLLILKKTLNKFTFCGEPAQLCEARPGQIRG